MTKNIKFFYNQFIYVYRMKLVVVLKAALRAGMRVTADLFSFFSVSMFLRVDYRVLLKTYKGSIPRKCINKRTILVVYVVM